jgi:hypothetical protein
MFYALDYFPEVYRRSKHFTASGASLSEPREPYQSWHNYRILVGGPDDKPHVEPVARAFRG